jgi:hypothetical protein
VRLAREWEDGRMPFAGGIDDQPAWTVEAIEVVRQTWSRMRADRDRRHAQR